VTRRVVRTSSAFFDQLDRHFGQSRGSNGKPSATDFLVFELPAVVEAFATRFDAFPEAVEGRSRGADGFGLIGVEVDLG
jgi:hypothetical protein